MNSTTDSPQRHYVTLINNSAFEWSFVLFVPDNMGVSNAVPLAAQVQTVQPGGTGYFMWGEKYCFVWGIIDSFRIGSQLNYSSYIRAPFPLQGNTRINLVQNSYGGVSSSDPVAGPAGQLQITTESNVTYSVIAVGITVGWAMPVLVAPAQPGKSVIFTPSSPLVYSIAALGPTTQGQVIDGLLPGWPQFSFAPGNYSMQVTLNSDNSWAVAPCPVPTAAVAQAPNPPGGV